MNARHDSKTVSLLESSHVDEMLSQFEQAVGAKPHSIADSVMRDILNSPNPADDYKTARDMIASLRYVFGSAILATAYDRPLYVGADKSLRDALEGQGMNGVREVNHALEMTEDSLSFSAM